MNSPPILEPIFAHLLIFSPWAYASGGLQCVARVWTSSATKATCRWSCKTSSARPGVLGGGAGPFEVFGLREPPEIRDQEGVFCFLFGSNDCSKNTFGFTWPLGVWAEISTLEEYPCNSGPGFGLHTKGHALQARTRTPHRSECCF